jgi:YrbI family 3-deoxy-D-manno-octulosonate 8-phosphate phosphatase
MLESAIRNPQSSLRIVALVPLRGGSKSIPKKNIKPIAGKPLCMHAIEAAAASGIFDKIIISTDSEEIAEVAKNSGLDVEISMRPPELATDTASTEAVMFYTAENYSFDVLCTIQVTSPLVTAEDFIGALNQFNAEGLDSMATGVPVKRFFWTEDGKPVNYDPVHRPRRQDFAGWIMENGAFYFTKREILDTHKCRLGGHIGIYSMPEESGVEIDEPQDWEIVEMLLQKRKKLLFAEKLENIKLLVTDVDGTLTDAGMYYSAEGEMLKKFNTRDAKGLELIRDELGIRIMILTRENSPIVTARAKKLKIKDCYIGVLDKPSFLDKFCTENQISFDEVAYLGDDVNDLECMQKAGFAACPGNAEEDIKAVSQYVASANAGEGAVREICNMILKNRL